MNKSGSKTFPVLNPLCRVPHFFFFIQNTRDLCFLQQKDFFRFYKINIRGSTLNKMWYHPGNLILSRAVPVPKGQYRRLPLAPKPPPIQHKKGLGLVRHPLADYRKKRNTPAFPCYRKCKPLQSLHKKGGAMGLPGYTAKQGF